MIISLVPQIQAGLRQPSAIAGRTVAGSCSHRMRPRASPPPWSRCGTKEMMQALFTLPACHLFGRAAGHQSPRAQPDGQLVLPDPGWFEVRRRFRCPFIAPRRRRRRPTRCPLSGPSAALNAALSSADLSAACTLCPFRRPFLDLPRPFPPPPSRYGGAAPRPVSACRHGHRPA